MIELYNKRYHRDRYNCGHFVIDFWREIKNENIEDVILNFAVIGKQKLKKLKTPVSPSIVIMRDAHRGIHCGVYYMNKIIHLIESGVRGDLIKDLKEFKMEFYQCRQ